MVQEYKSSGTRPNVEHEFPQRPAEVAAQWATDRLQAVGTNNIVRVTIVKGSVVEVPLAKSSGVKGIFTIDQSEQYDGTLSVRVEIVGPGGHFLVAAAVRLLGRAIVRSIDPAHLSIEDEEKGAEKHHSSMTSDKGK